MAEIAVAGQEQPAAGSQRQYAQHALRMTHSIGFVIVACVVIDLERFQWGRGKS